ncbi:RsmD family RNA methyltransferase [Porifericola rhodea]|uniref:THUMP-like domain-containing protein n=1 Tax=Porifericola rhodea TaxID=930972 RepID=UPI002665D129|nr:RsmD family RNA methyltransferase [Porifericola rhodea]WKN30265.1 RsmD family RNA methyltransferase [Porifericola rhodea]
MSIAQLLRPEVQAFIAEHRHDDPVQLVLSAHKYPDIPVKEVAAQLQAGRKARQKFPEWYQQQHIIFPMSLSVEQASSEATARYKTQLLAGQELVDLTGGMGIDLYYMSKSFQQATYVEQQEELVAIARHNFETLQAQHINCVHSSSEVFLQNLDHKVDAIYLDPARRDEHKRKVFRLEDCTPNVVELQDELLKKSEHVLIKTAPLLDIQLALQALKSVEKVIVIAAEQECKEVLYLLGAKAKVQPIIETVHLAGDKIQQFNFTKEGEAETDVSYNVPQHYLYESNAALLKAGAFKSVAQVYGLAKLHPNSHLYTSAELVDDFPGRIFRVIEVVKYSKKAIKAAVPSGKANITTRNFPDSVLQIRKKTGLKDGGNTYIFATTDLDGKYILLVSEKLSVY